MASPEKPEPVATHSSSTWESVGAEFLLDAGVEAVNLFVPGTQLARIVVQHGVKHVIEHRKHEA